MIYLPIPNFSCFVCGLIGGVVLRGKVVMSGNHYRPGINKEGFSNGLAHLQYVPLGRI